MSSTFIIALFVSLILLFASAIKWSLPSKKYLIIIFLSTVFSLAVYFSLKNLGLNENVLSIIFIFSQLIFYVGIILFLFFRDPERTSPTEPDVIVSPADGTVIYIKKLPVNSILSSQKKGRMLVFDDLNSSSLANSEILQIGISLLFTDVHINRSPISGKVSLLVHKPGKFLSLRDENAINVNERQTIVIENDKITIGLVQIASRLVRRIESYVKQNDIIHIGQRIGMIKFGSQVDLFIPSEKLEDINVKVGQYLYAGETIIGKIKNY